MNMGGDAWGWGMGGFSMLLWWGVVVVAVVVLVGWLSGTPTGTSPQSTALETLKERYAKGEIDKQEFEQKKRDLGG